MDIIRIYEPLSLELQQKLEPYHGCAAAIGNFDGVHRGHQKLIETCKSLSKKNIVITFSPHPENVFNKNNDFFKIFSESQNISQFKAFDVDAVVIVPFVEEFFNLTAKDFLEKVIINLIKPGHIVVGEDFKFGKNRLGNIGQLFDWQEAYGYQLAAVKKLSHNGAIVSSSVIRNHLRNGQIKKANDCLGERSFFIDGKVVHGKQLGESIGFPTVNIGGVTMPLKKGVYQTRVMVDGNEYRSISNFGSQPTVGPANDSVLETHIFDFSKDIYGENIRVYFDRFIREEIKFPNIESLKAQILKDVKVATTKI